LPGVGPYTARAVASIAFGATVGAVDTNVRRVMGRALGGSEGPNRPSAWLQATADASVDPERPGDWTHAVMDLGATVCRPRTHDCPACPVRTWCRLSVDAAAEAASGAADPAAGTPAPRRPVAARP